MADDQNNPYIDEDQQYAGLLKNLINPPDPTPLKPAATPASPAPTQTPAAQPAAQPEQHWESVTQPAPAATSTSGTAGPGKSWQDYYQQGQAKLEKDQGQLADLQKSGAGLNKINNPVLRGAARVGDVVLGTALPGLARNMPGTTQHNIQLQGQAQGRIGQDQAALTNASQMEDRAAQAEQRKAQAEKEGAQADYYAPVTLSPEQASAVGHPELAGQQMSQRALATMIQAKGGTDKATIGADARTESATTAANARTDAANIGAKARTDSATISADARKFGHATKATRGGPNEELRQPLIDAATAQVNKLNTYTYSPDDNDGRGGFSDPASPTKSYTPEEFTAMKNQISTKLDKDLATKKLRTLGVRFDVNSTTPGKAGQPTGAGAPTAATAKTAPTPPPGATHQYRDKSGNVVGYAVNGKYVAAGAK